MIPCCYVALNQYQPQENPYNSQLYQRAGWMPPNPFNQSQYVLEHYRPSAAAYCCENSQPFIQAPIYYTRGGGCCGK